MDTETCRYCDEDIDGYDEGAFLVNGTDSNCPTNPNETGQHHPDRDHWNGKDEEPGPDLATIEVAELYYGAVDSIARSHDWSPSNLEGIGEESETWNFLEAVNCYVCGRIIVGNTYTECPTCGTEATGITGPMINAIWPLPTADFTEENAAKLVDVAMCLVTVNEEVGLALTGGGMDMSWTIAKAYMVLGALPPATLTLPRFAGRDRMTVRDINVIRALAKSQTAMIERATWAIKRLEDNYPQAFADDHDEEGDEDE